ncbi:hypothetical protein AKJ37_00475 [candidate division MSBL1 archaeon SCGC-AAA259I09]|uniref:Putative 3-methyladenine DNA glycosylase n=4 Tax=candidate division MSBL1 TaxID=215777 RepID=A0A133UVT0_9EURY|nr:hypothetical protein AKJ66_02390 [candidate division MSBL1 archaeon SCGC-AAA259E22]KXA98301.1 hypothetical protein AKJ37_00475 [candidate division MSBL1 archaeon SCGC-AAA259I09]KXA98564.1 hypothetical protein AKJ39_01595 [candidate division MSBL1 archaeon SCGC-AAA259J03]KXA99740.1 hypothetical protein AKJ40_02505 [candidate division MSBL1 archaeon SCGC-AAA259M10]
MKLSGKFFRRDTSKVARGLLGKILTRFTSSEIVKGRIVETEAYYGKDDPASRASEKRTKINEIMWKKAGLALVYMVHGHWLFNVTTEDKGTPGAVLIRAVEPLEGLDVMKKRRGKSKLRELTSGPGKLTQAFDICKEQHGVDLTTSKELYISKPCGEMVENYDIGTSHRIGVTEDLERELRFYIEDNECVS